MSNSAEFIKMLALLSKPVQRALHSANIESLVELEEQGKKKLLTLHGFGPASIRIIEEYLGRKLKD